MTMNNFLLKIVFVIFMLNSNYVYAESLKIDDSLILKNIECQGSKGSISFDAVNRGNTDWKGVIFITTKDSDGDIIKKTPIFIDVKAKSTSLGVMQYPTYCKDGLFSDNYHFSYRRD